MHRATLILAVVLIAIGVAGLGALNTRRGTFFYANNAQPWGSYGMMGQGMMDGMMGYGGYGYGAAPGMAPITLD